MALGRAHWHTSWKTKLEKLGKASQRRGYLHSGFTTVKAHLENGRDWSGRSRGRFWRTQLRVRASGIQISMLQSRIPSIVQEYKKHALRMPYSEPLYFGTCSLATTNGPIQLKNYKSQIS